LGIVGYFARETAQNQKDLRAALSSLQLKVAEDYVTHDRFEQLMNSIQSTLRRIEDKLDSKQDKL
jgi:hypothetical protein